IPRLTAWWDCHFNSGGTSETDDFTSTIGQRQRDLSKRNREYIDFGFDSWSVHFPDELNAGGPAVGIEQFHRNEEWVNIRSARSGWFVGNHRSHAYRFRGMEDFVSNLDQITDIEEAASFPRGRKWRHVQDARCIVIYLFDLTQAWRAGIKHHSHWP